MRDLTGFRDAVEHYRKQVGRTEEELARELYISKGDLNKRLHDYYHPQSRRTWRLQPRHVKTIVETLARWGAITARKQAFALFTLIDFPALAKEIDWQTTPWNKLHHDGSPLASFPALSVPLRRRLFQARDLPKDYVPRPNAFNEIKRLLLAHEGNQTTAITTALRGAGGFGKTTLASAICHDPEIQEAFPDGILWVELGEKRPRPIDVLNELLSVLDPSEREVLTLEEARKRWQNVLKARSYLLVIDDVWHTEAMDELLKGGPRCRRLITTRNDQVLPETAKRVWVDAMEPEEAMTLLCEGVIDEWQHTLDQSVLEQVVVQQLGCWPLLVSLARGMLANQVGRLHKAPKQALALLKQAYEERGMTTFHLGDRDERQRNVDACLAVNLRQLEEWVPIHYQAQQRYLELVVLPDHADIPLSTLQIYWKGTGGLHEYEVEDLCLHFSSLSLLLPRDTEQPTIRVHDVLRSYLIQQVGNRLSTLHQRLLDAHQQHYHLTRWADLLQSEDYLWHHLIYHLCQAGNLEALQMTLTDLLYLTRKVVYVGVSSLEADLALAIAPLQKERAGNSLSLFEPLHRMILQISHLLRQVTSEADIGGLLLSYLHEEVSWDAQRLALEQELPRPFLAGGLPLPRVSSSALIRTLRGHTSMVNACGFSPDGTQIVSASSNGQIKLWDVATGSELFTLFGHVSSVNACEFSPDGTQIVSASSDGTLKLWDTATRAEIRTLFGHTSMVNACGFSPDGTQIVSASSNGQIKLWDVATGSELLTLSGHTDWVNACEFSPDGTQIVSASSNGTLKLWDTATGAEIRTLSNHTILVNACEFSPDGTQIVSASSGDTLKLWDAATGSELLTLSGHTILVSACGFSPDGTQIISASWDTTLKLWDTATGSELLTLSGHTSPVNACGFSPDGTQIISASSDHRLKLWDSSTGTEQISLSGHTDWIDACGFSPDGTQIVSVSEDTTLKLWDAATGKELLTLSGHIFPVFVCGFSPDGTQIISASVDGTLKLWDTATGSELLTLSGHTGWIGACGFSPDGTQIVSASEDTTLKLWDTATGKELLTLSGHADWVNACEFSPDGTQIVSASSDGTLQLWDTATGAEIRTLFGHTSTVNACEFSPDGTQIVSASSDGTLQLWDTATGAEIRTLFGHTSTVNACEFSPDGTQIVSASSNGQIKLWEVQSGSCVLTYPVDGVLLGCAFHPDREHLVAYGKQGIYLLRLMQ